MSWQSRNFPKGRNVRQAASVVQVRVWTSQSFAFQIGGKSAMRQTSATVDQLAPAGLEIPASVTNIQRVFAQAPCMITRGHQGVGQSDSRQSSCLASALRGGIRR